MDKNKRGSNYTEFETEMLLSLIQKFKHIIENKETNAVFAKLKQDTWQKIVDEYNAHAVTGPRNWQQVRHKYDNLKQKARKKVAKENRKRYYDAQEEHDKENDATNIKDIKKKAIDDKKGIFRTGGGSYRPSLSETESQVLALMAPQVNPLSNPYDDAAVYFGDAEVNMDTEIELLTSEEPSVILAANNKDINNEMAMQENLSDAEISYDWEVPEKDPVIDQMVNKKTTDLEWVNVSEPISLAYHCLDKVVVLDFWTYCCINCYHVLPDLAHLEKLHKVEDGLVVIGVHCAKFFNERETSNILAAVERYGIHHPVVNDAESTTWEALGIHCWPTLLVLGPGNKPIFVITGEGHRDELVWYVGAAIRHFGSRLSTAALPVAPTKHLKAKDDSVMKFPSKVALNPFYRGRAEEPFIAISDTGHHRVLLTDFSGHILRIIGGPEPGFKDGKMEQALFDSPQGMCWLSSSVLAVCDTGNHALRALHLDEGAVDILAGTGTQSVSGDNGGKCLGMQSLSSPWDVVLYTTPDMDMSVRPSLPPPPPPPGQKAPEDKLEDNQGKDKENKDQKRRVLLIACAGSHQIWALFLDTTIWWKYKTYNEGTCVCIAGSGAEAARNSAYPNTAAFAQPSGLALRTGNNSDVFIADSESSSIRKLGLTSGIVSTLCGGDNNPLNLFAFGDVDDIGSSAKLQHPLGVAYCEQNKTLYVADTYNHKIKKVDVTTQKVTTINPTMIETADPVKFNEPSGLSVSGDGKYLYIADTNNHNIILLNLAKNVCQEFKVRLPEPKFTEPENLILYKNDLFVNRKYGSLIILFNVSLDNNADTKNVKFTPGALQNWRLCVRDESNNDVTHDDFEFGSSSHKGTRLPGRVEMKLKNLTEKTHYRLYLSFQTALCDVAVCFSHAFTIRSTILVRDSVKMVESYKITCKVNPVNRSADNNAESNSLSRHLN